MAGDWTWEGQGCDYSGYTDCGDAFFTFKIIVLNDTTVLGFLRDTLTLEVIDSIQHTVHYSCHSQTYKRIAQETLVYSYKYHTLADSFYVNGASGFYYYGSDFYLTAPTVKLTHVVVNNLTNILGGKLLSGTAYDTLSTRTPPDSMYAISDSVEFKMVNDSTIFCNKDFIGVGNNELHLRRIDEAAKTITFQSFHMPGLGANKSTTLIFNYETQAIVFEQKNRFGYSKRHVLLHN